MHDSLFATNKCPYQVSYGSNTPIDAGKIVFVTLDEICVFVVAYTGLGRGPGGLALNHSYVASALNANAQEGLPNGQAPLQN